MYRHILAPIDCTDDAVRALPQLVRFLSTMPSCQVTLAATVSPAPTAELRRKKRQHAQGALDRDQLVRHVLVTGGQRPLRHSGDPVVQLGQSGGQRGDLGGGSHPTMIAHPTAAGRSGPRALLVGPRQHSGKGPRCPPVAL